MEKTPTTASKWQDISPAETLAILSLTFGIIGFFGQGIFQILDYLKNGSWPNWSAQAVMFRTGFYSEWLDNPKDWIGLQKILTMVLGNVSIGVLLFVFGFAMMIITSRSKKPDR